MMRIEYRRRKKNTIKPLEKVRKPPYWREERNKNE